MYEERRIRPEYSGDSVSIDYTPLMHKTSKYGGSSAFGYVKPVENPDSHLQAAGHLRKLPM